MIPTSERHLTFYVYPRWEDRDVLTSDVSDSFFLWLLSDNTGLWGANIVEIPERVDSNGRPYLSAYLSLPPESAYLSLPPEPNGGISNWETFAEDLFELVEKTTLERNGFQIDRFVLAKYGGGPNTWMYSAFRCSVDQRWHTNMDTKYAFSTGYGIWGGRNGEPEQLYCHPHGAERIRKEMHDTGKGTLYLTKDDQQEWLITDWPGEIKIKPTAVSRGRHNIGKDRYDAWFKLDDEKWYGVNIGDNQILRCKRLKQQ